MKAKLMNGLGKAKWINTPIMVYQKAISYKYVLIVY